MTEERLQQYRESIETESRNLAQLERERAEVQADVASSEASIQELQEELRETTDELEELTKKVEEVKKTTNRAARVLDQAIKEIATHVSAYFVSLVVLTERFTWGCRTTRSKNSVLSGLPSIANVGWTKSNSL